MDYDCRIVGGTIIDGTGGERFKADIGIKDGRIAAVGKAGGSLSGSATQTIDADGLVVAPGVIDVHTHYDAQVMWDRAVSISPWHGVTSMVMGNCGFGVAPTRAHEHELIIQTLEYVEGMSPTALRKGLGSNWGFETFRQYLAKIEAMGATANIGVLAGHTPIRIHVMGEDAFEREARPDEIAAMQALLRDAFAAGAVGFSTSGSNNHVGYMGKPVPSRHASFEETRALAGVMREVGAGVFQATVGPQMFYEQFEAIHADTSRPVTWSALLGSYWGPGSHKKHLAQFIDYQARNIPIVPQVACRPIMIDFSFADPVPFITRGFFKPVAEADDAGRRRLYADPAFRAVLKAEYNEHTKRQLTLWAAKATISLHPTRPELNETPLAAEAARRGVDPVDAALDIALETDLAARYRIAMSNSVESEIEEILRVKGPLVSLSDAGAHAAQLCDACYSTTLLGYWARDKGVLTLEDAVARLTSQPADLFGFGDRGRLLAGKAADIMIFDPKTIAASPLRRLNDLPGGEVRLVSDAIGMQLVMVNGQVVRRDGRDTLAPDGPLPGQMLRSAAYRPA